MGDSRKDNGVEKSYLILNSNWYPILLNVKSILLLAEMKASKVNADEIVLIESDAQLMDKFR